MPSQETYQRVFDRNSERVFAKNPEPPLPEVLRAYRLGCKPVILGELSLHGLNGYVPRQEWARSELIRIKSSGVSTACIFGELYSVDDLQTLFDEAGSMGASVRTLGGGRHFIGYLGEIEFAASEKSSFTPFAQPLRGNSKLASE
jgi:hypothetical protein